MSSLLLFGTLSLSLSLLKGVLTSQIVWINDVFEVVIGLFLAFFDAFVITIAVALVDLSGSNDLVLGVVQEFGPMGKPSGNSWHREEHSEELSWDT